MVVWYASVLSLIIAVACAQPQSVPPRSTRAITLVGDDVFLYGGGDCYSDFYSLHLDSANGWVAANAPWNNIKGGSSSPVMGTTSWAVGSTDGKSLLFYGQTLCPDLLAKDANSPHTFTRSSASIQFQLENNAWTQSATTNDILGPRQVKDDQPVPVQVVDSKNHMVYTFVYDVFTPQAVVLAPFIDAGSAIYHEGTILVIGGGKPAGTKLTGDDVDTASGWYKMDRCWVYTIATNQWSVRNLTAAGGNFPLPRRLAALVAVGNKIYMHGGNTTQTVSTESYAKDLWILDLGTWQWTKGVDSLNGRAMHTLINYQNKLLSFSGFEFETSKTKAAQNAYIMIFDFETSSWAVQFGTIVQTYFQRHAVAIISGSVGAFLVIVVLASVAARLWRRHTRGSRISKAGPGAARGFSINRKRSNKPFLASTAAHKLEAAHPSAETAASRLSGMTLAPGTGGGARTHETQLDLSALPRASESTVYDQNPHYQQKTYNPYAPVQQQQQVPLMSANALEQQGQEIELEPYVDDDEPEEKDARPLSHAAVGTAVFSPSPSPPHSGTRNN
ncbi:hypothetical protein BCR41DRAFT_2796 [Lobosporangium transversale]|uniref:Galactose oxidase n=1 Tax=Lobosporangium transversale TaxID=64571 RepID=A0A1Y2H2B8_9FUNG|nr:hypothetical protein BCR41DRAFT_2796 [Lobosporangium transversale]ORZ28696.1 hypothetical protein BCR41DRAFT_2796 [Lobosporangium transversale]|eukprot:XP_021886369.1 hypothetical protein BCR41DRAFT_2796 [Lobosporangium transversale]